MTMKIGVRAVGAYVNSTFYPLQVGKMSLMTE